MKVSFRKYKPEGFGGGYMKVWKLLREIKIAIPDGEYVSYAAFWYNKGQDFYCRIAFASAIHCTYWKKR